MIITIAFKVKNRLEIAESWPIKVGETTFFLECRDGLVQNACISYTGVNVDKAPKIQPLTSTNAHYEIVMMVNEYISMAIKKIMDWQTIISGKYIFDLDFDSYELRFQPENMTEEKKIPIRSFHRYDGDSRKVSCVFEQIGKAFYVGPIENFRIESTSHFREGRIAYDSGRYIDSYNNMFLFLETRYCDGKTKTAQQIQLLSENPIFISALKQALSSFQSSDFLKSSHLAVLSDITKEIKEKIKAIVHLRGYLRHHSLKSPQRWDPNKQDKYEVPARFLGLVVGHIVIEETLNDIYAPEPLKLFQEMAISGGRETKIIVNTVRLEKKPTLSLNISFPTTVMSSKLSLSTAREAISFCERSDQLPDTVKIEATHSKTGMELVVIELGVWAYTQARSIQLKPTTSSIKCHFEHFQSTTYMKHEFSLSFRERVLTIDSAWKLIKQCFDWIEERDPTTCILNLKIYLNDNRVPIVSYRTGAQVIN